jgi:hypothetical protein
MEDWAMPTLNFMPVRTRRVAITVMAAALLTGTGWGWVRFATPALPDSGRLNIPTPPSNWDASTFTIPVSSAPGIPMRVSARPVTLKATEDAKVPAPTAEKLWRLAEPAVVRVYVDRDEHHQDAGGGAIVAPSGLVLTALHVVDTNFKAIRVVWNDGQTRNASVVAKDPAHDLALLQISRQAAECFSFLRVAGPHYEEHYALGSWSSIVLMGFGGSPFGSPVARHGSVDHRLRLATVIRGSRNLFLDLFWADGEKPKVDPASLVDGYVGNAEMGDSGSPVLDERGTVIGIMIGGHAGGEGAEPLFVTTLPHQFGGLIL